MLTRLTGEHWILSI